ncbi:MAG: hypothetical protein DWQ01_08095 [Planctomycetota bacterium]|nr:MAG: hypothetical protein DWQ01_08095 [Planctomycetota bacterium]
MIPATLPTSFSGKLFLSAFSLAMLAGWVTATVNLYMAYAPLDGQQGMSAADVTIHYYGDRSQNRFTTFLHGSMLENLSDPDKDLQVLHDWALAPGLEDFDAAAHREMFETRIFPVLDEDCLLCHEPGGKAEYAPMESYEQVLPMLEPDRGPSTMMLARSSHYHLIGMGTLALLTGLLAFAFLPARPAGILSCLSIFGLLMDVAGWWLTRETGWAAPIVMAGGASFAGGVVLSHLSLLARYWRAVPV